MELDGHPKEYCGKFRRKVVPWYCQRKYHQDSHSHNSYQTSFTAASYKRKLKSILNNNKSLALALQICRSELADKESIIIEHAKNLDLISFSRLKLLDMAENLKKVSTSLGETLSLLQLHVATGTSQSIQSDLATKSNFKKKFETLVSEPIEEVVETSGYETNSSTETNPKENEVPAMDNKPVIKEKNATAGNKCTSLAPVISKKNKPIRKEHSKARKMKPRKVKLSRNICVRSSTAIDETPSYLLGLSTDSESMIKLREDIAATIKETKNSPMSKKKDFLLNGLGPKQHYSNMLGYEDIQEKEASHKKDTFILQDAISNIYDANAFEDTEVGKQIPFKKAIVTINQKSKNSPKSVSATNENSRYTFAKPTNTGFNLKELGKETIIVTPKIDVYSENNRNVKDVATKIKGILKRNIEKIPPSVEQPMYNKPIILNEDTNNALPLEITADTLNVNTEKTSYFNSISPDYCSTVYSTQPRVVVKKTMNLIKKQPIAINKSSGNAQNCVEKFNNNSQKANLKQSEPQTFRRKSKVQFYFEKEEKIEQLGEREKFVDKSKTRNSKKRPLKESTQNIPSELTNAVPPKKKALSPYVPDTLVLAQGSNTYIVTAEVHRPPDGYMSEKRSSRTHTDVLNMQPSVVLTDIFRSTNLSSNFLSSVKPINKPENASSKKALNSDMDYQSNEENENSAEIQLMEDETALGRRRSKVSTYKEPSLNVKMRRCR